MKHNSIDQYCRRISKELICLPETKKELLAGLRAELSAFPPEDTVSLKKIEAKYGKTSIVAAELQEAVSRVERSSVLLRQKRHFRRCMIGSVALIVLLLLLILFLLKSMPFTSITWPAETFS